MGISRYGYGFTMCVLLMLVLIAPVMGVESQAQVIRKTQVFKVSLYNISSYENAYVVRVYGGYIYLVTRGANGNWFRVLKIDPNMSVVASVNESLSECEIVQARLDSNGNLYIAVNSPPKLSYIYVYDANLNRKALYNITRYESYLKMNSFRISDFDIVNNTFLVVVGAMNITSGGKIFLYGFAYSINLATSSLASSTCFDYSTVNGVATAGPSMVVILAGSIGKLYYARLDSYGNFPTEFYGVYSAKGYRVFVVGNYIITDYIQVLDLSTFSLLYEYPLKKDVIVPIDSNKIAYIYGDNIGILYNYSYSIETSLGYGLSSYGAVAGDIYNGIVLLPHSGSANIVILEEIPGPLTPSTLTITTTTTITTSTTVTTTKISPVPVYQTVTTTVTTAVGMAIEMNIIAIVAMIIVLAIGLIYVFKRARSR